MTKQSKPRLGRGLASLIGTPVEITAPEAPSPVPAHNQSIIENDDISPRKGGRREDSGVSIRLIDLDEIVPSSFQPREVFDENALAGLAASIRSSGVMQPTLVRRSAGNPGKWELVAGERRWRAARIAGLTHIPGIVVELDDLQAAEWALVENVQREDLSAMERARALRGLVDDFGVSHQDLGERVGLDRSSVTNLIRLTELETEVQALLSHQAGTAAGQLSLGHGKALLGAKAGAARVALALRAARESWSVRRLEQAVRETQEKAIPKRGSQTKRTIHPQIADIERQLGEAFGTKVRLATSGDGTRGRITIDFYGVEHFEGIVRTLGVRIHP